MKTWQAGRVRILFKKIVGKENKFLFFFNNTKKTALPHRHEKFKWNRFDRLASAHKDIKTRENCQRY